VQLTKAWQNHLHYGAFKHIIFVCPELVPIYCLRSVHRREWCCQGTSQQFIL